MKLIVISLKSSAKRRTEVDKQLKAAGLAYTFFDAVSGDDGAGHFETYSQDAYKLNTGRLATPGEIGCYASHLSIWKQAVAENESVVILEDDCRLDPLFPDALRQTEQWIGPCGFIRLEPHRKMKKRVAEASPFTLYYCARMPHNTTCYAISPAVASVFIEKSKVLTAPVDIFIKKFWEHGQPIYAMKPTTVDDNPETFTSDINAVSGGGRPALDRHMAFRIKRQLFKGWIYLKRDLFNLKFCIGRVLSRNRIS